MSAGRSFLLLTGHLGVPERPVLTSAQLREVTAASSRLRLEGDGERELTARDLCRVGLGRELAERVLRLLGDEDLLEEYLERGKKAGCIPVFRGQDNYPVILRKRLGGESPGCLWMRGDVRLLDRPGIALVGNRVLLPENRMFAETAGREAARQGIPLISGNARGADMAAQNACREAGGSVISVVADVLAQQPEEEGHLYISEEAFDEPFSAPRALHRNRVIHGLGVFTLVAQCTEERGGTWSGVIRNLHGRKSPVFCYRDGSAGMAGLVQRGAVLIGTEELKDLVSLQSDMQTDFWVG